MILVTVQNPSHLTYPSTHSPSTYYAATLSFDRRQFQNRLWESLFHPSMKWGLVVWPGHTNSNLSDATTKR